MNMCILYRHSLRYITLIYHANGYGLLEKVQCSIATWERPSCRSFRF